MNARILMIPFFFIRFALVGSLSKEALRRAAYFAPLEGNEKKAIVPYQLSTIFLILYPNVLKIQTETPSIILALLVYILGNVILTLSAVSFSKPEESGVNTKGIYRISRNPIYLGYFLYFLGCVLLTKSVLLFIGLLVFQFSTHWIILSEERWCLSQFGEEYTQYMEKVRRYL